MKLAQIAKIIAQDLGTADTVEINKLLKVKTAVKIKYRFSGKKLGHFGFTGFIKTITTDGIKVFDINKVTLIKFSDIEKFEKAKPRVARPTGPKPVSEAKKAALKPQKNKRHAHSQDEDEDEDDDLDIAMESEAAPIPPRKPPRPKKPIGKSGSAFIPLSRKKETN